MSRTFLEVFLFLAPFAFYAIYLFATERDAREKEHWRLKVLTVCAVVGCALVIVSLIAFAHFGGAPPDAKYTPAHMENGKLVPGQTK